VRPPKVVRFDRPEDPRSMDEILKKIGATPIDWAYKVECCGAGFSVSRTDLVARLGGEILEDALSRGAEAVIVACPMCHSNLDMRAADRKTGPEEVFDSGRLRHPGRRHGSGTGRKDLGLHRHFVPVVFSEKNSDPEEGRIRPRIAASAG